MLKLYLILLAIMPGIKGVFGLSPPSFVSDWVRVNTSRPANLTTTFRHDFGVYPLKADVQVMSADTGYIFPGVSSATVTYGSGTFKAGVICTYNTSHVVLQAPTPSHVIEYGLIFTGLAGWTSRNKEYGYAGSVRVRLWHPDDFPTSDFNHTFYADTSMNNNIWRIPHGGNDVPDMTLVRGICDATGFMFEAVGSSMHHPMSIPINGPMYGPTTISWGAVVYGVNRQQVTIGIPASSKGALFSNCGWGEVSPSPTSSCTCNSGTIEVLVWYDMSSSVLHSSDVVLVTGQNTLVENSFVMPQFNITTDLVTVTALLVDPVGDWNSHIMPATGAAMSTSTNGSAGIVYAYSKNGTHVRLWHPTDDSAGIFRYGPNMGRETWMQSNRKGAKATGAVATIKIWKGANGTASTSPPTPMSTTTTSSSSTAASISTSTSTSKSTSLTTSPTTAHSTSTMPPSTTVPTSTSTSTTTSTSMSTSLTPATSTTQTTTSADEYITLIEATILAERIAANLTVPLKSTSKYVRTLECAQDERASSTVIGLSGLSIMILYLLLVFVPDASRVVRAIVKAYQSKNLQSRNSRYTRT